MIRRHAVPATLLDKLRQIRGLSPYLPPGHMGITDDDQIRINRSLVDKYGQDLVDKANRILDKE